MAEPKNSSTTVASSLKVFISYSRKDAIFTRRLANALAARGYAPDFDQATFDPDNISAGIAAEDEWWKRLRDMIAASDTMIFIVSPDSASSKVCDEEIAYARGLGKRVIPILWRPIDFSKAPPRLSALNVKLNFTNDSDEAFSSALDGLYKVLDGNVAWYRENARLTTLAARWDTTGRTTELLLSAADLRALGKSLEDRPRDAPEPSTILLDFRDKSHEKLEAEEKKQRRIIGRAFVKPAEDAIKEHHYEHAIRLAAAGALMAKDLGFDRDVDTRLWPPAVRAIFENRTHAVLRGHAGPVVVASFSLDGTRIVTAAADRSARVWDAGTGKLIASLEGHTDAVKIASFSPDGTRRAPFCCATLKGQKDWVHVNGTVPTSPRRSDSARLLRNSDPSGWCLACLLVTQDKQEVDESRATGAHPLLTGLSASGSPCP